MQQHKTHEINIQYLILKILYAHLLKIFIEVNIKNLMQLVKSLHDLKSL